MKTQNERLKKYLMDYGEIEPITAWFELGIYRLGARIWDLKREGLDIVSGRKTVTNRFGEKHTVANYKLSCGQERLAL